VIWVIIITFVGFVALAVALLLPIYRMFQREDQLNEERDRNADLHRRRE
jgi:hypothetical protein